MTRAAKARLAALTAACCALWALFLHFDYVGFVDDALYYLEPAMNVARGRGVVTDILYPAQIAALHGRAAFPAPFLWHGPLAPGTMGLLIRLFGLAPWAALIYSFGLTLLTGLAAYALALDAFGEGAALLSAALYWTCVGVWRSNVGELTDPLFSALLALSALLLWESRRRHPERWCAAAGAALALASSARLAGQVYWPGFVAAAFVLHRRARPALALAAGLLAGLLPLLAYNWSMARVLFLSPGFYLLLYTRSFPGAAAATSYLGVSTLGALVHYPKDVLIKALTGPLYSVSFLLSATATPWLSAALVAGLVWPVEDAGAASYRRLALWLCVPVFLVNATLSVGSERYLQPLYPLAAPLAAGLLVRAARAGRAAWRPWLVGALAAWALLSPAALLIKDSAKTRASRAALYADLGRLGAWVAAATPEGQPVYTDDPPTICWHSGRPAVHLGYTLEDTRATLNRAPASALLLTSLRLHSSDYDQAFRDAFRDGTRVLAFEPCSRFESATVRALLLTPPGACRR